MPDPGDRRFLVSLEGLRGLAALAIVLYHLRESLAVLLDGLLPGSAEALQPLLQKSRLAVDLFFILSGFILAHVYLGDRAPVTAAAWRRYLIYRVARIYPLHLFMLALWVPYLLFLVTAIHPEQSFAERAGGLPAVIERIFLVQMWWRGQAPLTMNVPDWSISVEWALYLVFPLLVLLLRRLARESDAEGRALLPRTGALALLLAAFAAAYLVIVFQKSGIHGYGYIWLLRGGCEFLVGIALWQLYARGYGRDVNWRRLGLPLAAVLILLGSTLAERDWYVLPGLALLLFVEAGRALDPGARGGLLARPPVLWLGRISYALYLGHWLVVQGFEGVVKYGGLRLLGEDTAATAPLPTAAVVFLGSLALSLVFAALLHRLVELPARRWLRARAGPRREELQHA